MNTLSWMIYISEFVGNLQSTLTVITFISFILAFLVTLHYSMESDDNRKTCIKFIKILYTTIIVCAFLLLFIPSKQTFMMIVASEYGEKVIENKKVQDIANPAMDLLKAWIDSETKKLTKPNSN